VADDPDDIFDLVAHRALQRIDFAMGFVDGGRRVDPTMEVDEKAARRRPDANIMDLAQMRAFGATIERVGDRLHNRGIGVATRDFARLHGLDVSLNFDIGTDLVLDGEFQTRGDLMGFAEAHTSIDFDIEAHRAAAFDFLDRDMVDGNPPPPGDQQHALQHALIVESARIGSDGQSGLRLGRGDLFENIGLDRRDAFERQRTRYEDADFPDRLRAAAAQSDIVDRRYAWHGPDQPAQAPRQALRRRINQSVDGSPPQAVAGDGDEERDADRRQGIGVVKPGARRREADQDENRRDQVAREMQRVGGERLALGVPGDLRKAAPTKKIDADCDHDDGESDGARIDCRGSFPAEPAQGLESNNERKKGKQARLGQRRHRLEFGVAERVLLIGRLVAFAHGEKGQDRRAGVERAVAALGNERQRAGEESGRELGEGEADARKDRGEGGALLAGGRFQLGESLGLLVEDYALRPLELKDAPARLQRFAPRAWSVMLGGVQGEIDGEKTMEFLHTMVRVTNLDASLDFFVNKFGLTEVRRVNNEKGRYTLVFLAASDDIDRAKKSQAPLVELTHNWDPEVYTGGRNFGHLAYSVDDIYKFCDKLMKAGVTINRPPRDGHMAFIRTPDNISIELIQKGGSLPAAEPWASMPNTGVW
jgi:lactoylglutathione lyase